VADARVDVVFIASPNFLQAPYTTIAAQAGKHVLVEKPMAVPVDEVVEIVQTCREHGVKLGTGIRGRTEIPFEVFREARSGNRSAWWVHPGRMADSKYDATLYSSHGRIVMGDSLRTALQGSLEGVSDTVNTTVSYQQDALALYMRQVEAFNHAIQPDTEPSASGLDGLRVV
jgi:predicted dehydrogenase